MSLVSLVRILIPWALISSSARSASTSTIDEEDLDVTIVNPPLDAAEVDNPWTFADKASLYSMVIGAVLMLLRLGPARAIAETGSEEDGRVSTGEDCVEEEDMIWGGLGGAVVARFNGALLDKGLLSRCGSNVGMLRIGLVDDCSFSCKVIREVDAAVELGMWGWSWMVLSGEMIRGAFHTEPPIEHER